MESRPGMVSGSKKNRLSALDKKAEKQRKKISNFVLKYIKVQKKAKGMEVFNPRSTFYLPLLLIVFLGIGFGSSAQSKKYAITKIVVDAGHGGHDGGCHGKHAKEKDVALAVSLKFGKMVEENFPSVKVIYTRKTDVFVTLNDRADIANDNKADLFICIHCNSGGKSAHGTETFVMGLHKSEDNLHLAQRENASILMEEDYQSRYENFNPNSPEAYIIFSLRQNAFLEQSLSMASKVESRFRNTGRPGRGVKQAGFWVLYRTTMPSILIETGFLTNPEEEKYMASDKGQEEIARSIFEAFKDYKIEAESVPAGVPIEKEKKENKKEEEKPFERPKNETGIIPSDTILFSVQIGTGTRKKPMDLSSAVYAGLEGVKEMMGEDGSIKYLVGREVKYEDAVKIQESLKEKGLRSPFVVAYKGQERIPVGEAIRESRVGEIKK